MTTYILKSTCTYVGRDFSFLQNMKHMLKTPEVVVDSSTMHKVPIEKERVQENKGTATPKKVPSNLILF